MPEKSSESGFGPEEFAARTGVSRETLARLKAYAELLTDWNARHNLVAKSTLPDLWRRHFWDCAQLAPLIPETAQTLADLGSGAGFPGLVLAAMRRRTSKSPCMRPPPRNAPSCRPPRSAWACRSKSVMPGWKTLAPQLFDVVTARALRSPAPALGLCTADSQARTAVCLFLKGQNVGAELTEAHKSWNMKASVKSRARPILRLLYWS